MLALWAVAAAVFAGAAVLADHGHPIAAVLVAFCAGVIAALLLDAQRNGED
jgi:hypothetical protein